MSYNRPGVYLTERLVARPIPAVGASNAAGACVGLFERGPEDVTLVTSWYEFSRKFGGYNAAFPAATAVAQFFRNGGSELFVRRVLTDLTDATNDKSASFAQFSSDGTTVTITTSAAHGMVVGNTVDITGVALLNGSYTTKAGTTGSTIVFDKAVSTSAFTTYNLTSDVVTITTSAAHNLKVGDTIVVTGVSAINGTYTTTSGTTGSTIKFSKTASDIPEVTNANGTVRVSLAQALTGTAKVEGGFVASSKASVNILDASSKHIAEFEVKDRGEDGNNYRVTVTAASVSGYYDVTFYREINPTSGVSGSTTDDIIVERYSNVVFDDSASNNYAVTVINNESALFSAADAATPGSETNIPDATENPWVFSGGADGTAPTAAEVTAVFADLDTVTKPLVVFLPGLFDSYSDADAETIQNAAIDWADAGTGFAVLETASGLTVSGATVAATDLTASSHAAVYYPHVYIQDPVGRTSTSLRLVGPSAAVAGLYIQTDRNAGPFKTPAGLRAPLSGVVATEKMFTNADLEDLHSNAHPVNAIRDVPGAGIVPMGGRTLLQDGTANRYIAMRRSLIYIRHRLEQIAEVALFEPNDSRLWSKIRTTMGVFLTEYFNQGGLRGNNTAQAFYVKCDAENNGAQSIQNGELHIEIGVALEYPAEFIVITLNQSTFE